MINNILYIAVRYGLQLSIACAILAVLCGYLLKQTYKDENKIAKD